MKEDQVNHCYSSDDKWQKEVECEESSKGGIIYREAAPDSLNKGAADVGDCGE